MRKKDEIKQEAVIQATIKLVNEIGFVATSVSKIAKEAGVSPATIYIYYKNKEDLLVSTYVEIKKKLSSELLKDFDDSLPIRDIVKKIWLNTFDFIRKKPDFFIFIEQFSNSPFSDLVNPEEVEKFFLPLNKTMQRGIAEKIIKNVHPEILTVFVFYPAMILSNRRLCHSITLTEEIIDNAFTMAWDAIKL